MTARMGAIRAVGLGAVATMAATGLAVVGAPSAQAADPVLPGPTSSSWIAVKKGGAAATDPTNDFTPAAHLNLTPAGGTLGVSTAYLSADLEYAYFRFHVAEAPAAAAAGAYIIQFDTDTNTAGWERAIRYEPFGRTVGIYDAAANSGAKEPGTLATTVPATSTAGTSYPGADGGAFVAFAVPRARLTSAGINLGRPMVFGGTTLDGAALDAKPPLLGQPKSDILGVAKTTPAWATIATDPLAIDSDGDGIADGTDNCPVVPNDDQADDDAALDNSYPPGTPGTPDGTEGLGNLCDPTPRGLDVDEDGVGILDDECPERAGLQANGCPAQSTTVAVLRYNAKKKRFSGNVRADYDECVPRRNITVLKVVAGPDKQLGSVRSNDGGGYSLAKRATKGKYYAKVDPKNNFEVGVRCFGVHSPRIDVR